MRLPEPPLLVITDRRQARRPLEDIAAAVFAGGCRWLSLREKDLPPGERLALLVRLVAVGRDCGATVGVHDDLDAAIAAKAGALHLPDGGSVVAARARLGPAILLGVSAHDEAGLAGAAAEGADYATLSPIFISNSKPGYGPALGLASLAHAPLPVLALGGIDATNAAAALAAGASGVAVMGAAMAADDPASAIAGICAALAARPGAGHS